MRLYRFRSNSNYTLDELEKNYFYFALPEELNDPMEGFINLYWEGDYVLWRNLLKHYVYTLANSIFLSFIDRKISKMDLPIFFDESKFPTDKYKSIFEEMRDNVFEKTEIKDFLSYIKTLNHRITQKELSLYLRIIHYPVLYSVISVYKKHNLIDWDIKVTIKIDYKNVFKKLSKIMPAVEQNYKNTINTIFDALYSVKNNIDSLFKFDYKNIKDKDIKNFFLIDFTNFYMERISELVFSVPCTVCFMENFNSPSQWSYYASNHKGICLIFDDGKNNSDKISFEFKTNWGKINCTTQKVKYQNEYAKVNFFRMLGTLPISMIEKSWLSDWDGNNTSFVKIGDNYLTEEWRKEYNMIMSETFSTKLPDWEKEAEHRIVLDKNFIAGDPADTRKFSYNFTLLKGIIFGIKTDDDYKMKVIEIITKKCKEITRTDFKFFQAEYDEEKGCLIKVDFHL